MSRKLRPEEKKILRQIAGFYGCKVIFKNMIGGAYSGKTIEVDQNGSIHYVLSVFFHELAHFVNWKTNKYPYYHNPKYFDSWYKKFKSHARLVRYALNAELATEKLGKKLCKEWFPEIKYQTVYKNNKESYAYLDGYFTQ